MSRPSTPTIKISNLAEEKEKFFAAKNYNPQFSYLEHVDEEVLTRYGFPSEETFRFAENILEKTRAEYGSFSELSRCGGEVLKLDRVEREIERYLRDYSLVGKLTIVFRDDFVSRTAVDASKDGQIQLKIQTPISYREKTMQPVLNHEIGTHVLRWVNEFRQPWYGNPVREEFNDFLETEEGLAILHAAISHPIKLFFMQALHFYAVFYAQKLTFTELFNKIEKVVEDKELSWVFCLRAKRGLKDTSQPGGYTKDIVYLKGAIDVARWLERHEYDPRDLYLGKIAFQDVDKCLAFKSVREPVLPLFSKSSGYSESLFSIIKENELIPL
jgi:hypothetical protein